MLQWCEECFYSEEGIVVASTMYMNIMMQLLQKKLYVYAEYMQWLPAS